MDEVAGAKPNSEAEGYVIERIDYHTFSGKLNHPHTKKGEKLYRVRLYGYGAQHDTYDPIQHILHGMVGSCYRRKKAQVPLEIDKSILGWIEHHRQ